MKSISKIVDGHAIAAQVRMEKMRHAGAFLLLEGASDVLRFERFIDETACSIVITYGKEKAVTAIELLHDDGLVQVCGYDRRGL